MPVKTNPGDIRTGAGKPTPESGKDIVLIGGGMAGSPPEIGQLGYIPPDEALGDARPGLPPDEKLESGAGGSLSDHILACSGAHTASAIDYDPRPPLIQSRTVQGALDELEGVIPGEPPKLGWHFPFCVEDPVTLISGVPDWGALKSVDMSMQYRDADLLSVANDPNDAADVYPYFLEPSAPSTDLAYPAKYVGADPMTDPVWNTGLQGMTTYLTFAPGSGPGLTVGGAFTKNPEVERSIRLQPVLTNGFLNFWGVVTVSGTVYPADRGVLALLHFPPDGDINDFLSQDLLDRCVAAVLLGQGITDGGSVGASVGDPCQTGSCGGEPLPQDGDPGGIFEIGHDVTSGTYDPFAYPGRATGQFDLQELHLGLNHDGQTLPSPWDVGGVHILNAVTPALGQVRLGTDPIAGEGTLPYGIPILGAGRQSYSPVPTDFYPAMAPAFGLYYIGNTILPDAAIPPPYEANRIEANFLGYRLPYLDDYSLETGLKYTPRGPSPSGSYETKRYFRAMFPFSPGALTEPNHLPWQWESDNSDALTDTGVAFSWTLDKAGQYPAFKHDYWMWQLARYRHCFLAKPTSVPDPNASSPADREIDYGTYWMVHFRTEDAFERFVSLGEMAAATEVYGAHLAGSPALLPEDYDNVRNGETGMYPTVLPPFGTAPEYGYAGKAYHQVRGSVATSKQTDHVLLTGNVMTSTYDWTAANLDGGALATMSGVTYFTPKDWITGNRSFYIDWIDLSATDAWLGSYRSDEAALSMPFASVPPAQISSPSPVMLRLTPYSHDLEGNFGLPSFNMPPELGVQSYRHPGRAELPFTSFTDLAGNPRFTEATGPASADDLVLDATAWSDPIWFEGDADRPAFSVASRIYAFFRRPLANDWEHAAQPPYHVISGHGIELSPDPNKKILYHSTGFVTGISGSGHYGNFPDNSGPAPVPNYDYFPADPELHSLEKDTNERFLDEVYRYHSAFPWLTPPGSLTWVPYQLVLVGPGILVTYPGNAMLTIPVRPGRYLFDTDYPVAGSTNPPNQVAPFDDGGWLEASYVELQPPASPVQHYYYENLTGAFVQNELQVAGLPARNPPLSDWAMGPYPSCGLLRYPKANYADGNTRPDLAVEGIFQPDYSVIAAGIRSYVRVFDMAFSHALTAFQGGGAFDIAHPKLPTAKDRATFVLEIDGLHLSDFAHPHRFATFVGDPSVNPAGSRIAILVKVPGITTWMDLGRIDGGGPSKFDVALDGAGCYTGFVDAYDPESKVATCTLTVTNDDGAGGPLLHNGIEHVVGTDHRFEVPLMVKVMMDVLPNGTYDFTTDPGSPMILRPGASSKIVRGVVGISVVYIPE